MRSEAKWSRPLLIVGLIATLIGAIDPLEGSLIILPGVALATLGALLSHSRHRAWLVVALALVAAGVGALWGLSAAGGFGGSSGRSNWWGVLLLPYVLGWLLALIGSFRVLRERRA